MSRDAQPNGLITIGDLRNQPKPTWLIDGLLPEQALVEVYGLEGSYKTFLWLDVALCQATGKKWHGRDVTQAPVVYISGESNTWLQNRVDAWYFAHGYNEETSLLVPFYMTRRGYSIYDEDEVGDVLHFIRQVGIQPGQVVYDTLAACCGGGARRYDENSNSDFHVVRENMARIRDATGATVTVIAHEGEYLDQFKHKRPSGWPRGASAQRGNMDMLIQVGAKPHKTRLGGTLTLTNTKPREMARFAPVELETVPWHLPDGVPSLVVHGEAPTLNETAGRHRATREDVRGALRELGRAKPAQVADYLRCDRKAAQWHLGEMLREGEAVRDALGIYRLQQAA